MLRLGAPRLQGEQTVVLSITEAFAGSDVAGLRTTAVLDASGETPGRAQAVEVSPTTGGGKPW